MSTPIALITADWHIRRRDAAWVRHPNLNGDVAYGLEQLLQIADQYSVQAILAAGDIFDEKPQRSDSLLLIRQFLDRCEQRHLSLWYVQGQHEDSTPPVMSAVHSWPLHMHQQSKLLGELLIHGLDYQHPANVEAALQAVPQCDILLTHQVWQDFMGVQFGDVDSSCVPDHVKMIVTGDLHQTLIHRHDPADRAIVSPGSLCMQSLGEPANKFVYILHDDLSVHTLALRSRACFEHRIDTADELEELLAVWATLEIREDQAGVPDAIKKNILRIRANVTIPQVMSRLNALSADVHLFVTPLRQERPEVTVDEERRITAVTTGGLEGCLTAFYGDAAAHQDAMRLLRAPDARETIQQIIKERIDGVDDDGEGTLQDPLAAAGSAADPAGAS